MSNLSNQLNIGVERIKGFFVAVFLPARPIRPVWAKRDELNPAHLRRSKEIRAERGAVLQSVAQS